MDFYDVLNFAFPFLEAISIRGKLKLDSDQVGHILRQQLARGCLFFGLSKTRPYYPILIPSPYANEFFSCITSSSVISPPTLDVSRVVDMAFSQPIDQQWTDLFDYSSHDRTQADTIKNFNWLLLALTGQFTQGLDTIDKLFSLKRICFHLDEWRIPSIYKTILQKAIENGDFNYDDSVENDKWKSIFAFHNGLGKPKFPRTWINDIMAIRYIRYVNEILNPENIIVLFVSSGPRIKRVLSPNYESDTYSLDDLYRLPTKQPSYHYNYTDKDGQHYSIPFYRTTDIMRLYFRYSDGEPDAIAPNKFLENIESPLQILREFTLPLCQ